jgi:hypothetical protein
VTFTLAARADAAAALLAAAGGGGGNASAGGGGLLGAVACRADSSLAPVASTAVLPRYGLSTAAGPPLPVSLSVYDALLDGGEENEWMLEEVVA